MTAFDLFPHWDRHALLTCGEMRCAEEACCARGPLVFYDLMQNAGQAVARIIQERWAPCRVLAMCGPGNNGGDGYVAAEALRRAGWPVVAGAVATKTQPPDAAKAARAWKGETKPLAAALLNEAELVIDALFGTGLQRPLEGDVAQIIEAVNARRLPVVAADFPSGLDGDTGRILGVATAPKITVTWFRKKRGHALLPGASRCGEIVVVDVGMKTEDLTTIRPSVAENHPDLWLSQFPFPQPEGHKYSRGHALVAGGPVMTGASRLAARAAQRMGAGLVTLAAPEAALPIYAGALESVIVQRAETLNEWQRLLDDPKRNAVLAGPGLGVNARTIDFVRAALATRKPCVLDADALTSFADEPDELFAHLHPSCVLTPHEGEFARLFKTVEGADKITRAQKAAEKAGCIVLLKGADTVIATPEGFSVVNGNAPPFLATGGAGDVLAGMMLGLLSPGMPVFGAAAAAAWLHGRVADLLGPGLIAEDIVNGLPHALKDLSAAAGKTIVGP